MALSSSSPLRNPFPPIADYAFLSDWETTCLISPAGSVEWLCVPRPDSPSVFGAIPLVLRYRVHETDDGLSGEEGTFTICSFWLVSALVEIGEVGRAKRLCERLLSFASPLLLYAEEIEPRSGRHLGNFPQAFTHLALINAVVHVIRAEEEADSSGMFQPANAPM